MVQITTSESSKILRCSLWLARSGHLVNKSVMKGDRIRAARNMGRGLAVAERAMSLILWRIGLCLCIDTLVVSYIGEHVWDGGIILWQRVIAYHATIGNVDVVWVMQSTSASNIPNWLSYIYIQMAFKLGIISRGYWQDLDILELVWNERRGHVSRKVSGLLHSDAGHLVLGNFGMYV